MESPTRRRYCPRLAETYRGARRNAWRGSGQAWNGAEAKLRPYQTKEPLLRFKRNKLFRWELADVRQRKQPKTYPYASERQNKRNKWRRERWVSRLPVDFDGVPLVGKLARAA